MKHAQSKALFAYWNGVRSGRRAPERAEIDPAAIRDLLPDTFILEVEDKISFAYRLAGTRVCAAFGHELRGEDFLMPWSRPDRDALSTLLWSVLDEGAAAVAGWKGISARGHSLSFEMLLLPLLLNGDGSLRVLGSSAAFEAPFWFGAQPIVRAELVSLRILWPDGVPAFDWQGTRGSTRDRNPDSGPVEPPVPALAALRTEPIRIRHLAVYEGGRK
jgi:hypothetical protein